MSERAISEGRIEEAEHLYMVLYSNTASSAEMRSKALYQIGLIYMSPYNEQNNNRKAMDFFRKINTEFPTSSINERASYRINELLNRQ